MPQLQIINKINKFVEQHAGAMDRALNRMAIDIERLSKARVPFKDGHLKASGNHRKLGPLNYITFFNKKYARFQEFGGDEKRVVRNYSAAGKQKFYLKSSGDEIAKKAVQYMKEEANKIKIAL